MKFRFLFFSLILSLYLSACENPIFRKITGVYEASFETNGGSPVDSFEAVTIKTAPVPTKDGYYFEGWHINSSFADKKVEFPYDLADDTKFYAKWLKPCTVTFETNGGTPISSYVTAIIFMAGTRIQIFLAIQFFFRMSLSKTWFYMRAGFSFLQLLLKQMEGMHFLHSRWLLFPRVLLLQKLVIGLMAGIWIQTS